MNIKEAIASANETFDNPKVNLCPHFVGQPGIGKSKSIEQMARQRAKEAGLEFYSGPENYDKEKYGFIDIRLSQLEAADLTGIPVPTKDMFGNTTVKYTESPFLPKEGQGILFIDEFAQADKTMFALSSQLIYDKRVGVHKVGDGWDIIAASNRASDKSISSKLPQMIKDRLIKMPIDFDLKGFIEHLHDINAPEEAIAYAKYQPGDLQSFDPNKEDNCTPRSFTEASMFLSAPQDLKMHLISGCIGEGYAAKLLGFAKIWKELPSPEEIVEDPKTAKVPDKADVQFATVSMLAFRVVEDTFSKMMEYVKRLPDREYQTLFVKSALEKQPQLADTDAFNNFLSENVSVLV